LPGGTNTTPRWTTVDGTQAACGTCHGLPPAAPHVAIAQCDLCHGAVVGPGPSITTPALHINGIVESTTVHPPGWSMPTSHGRTANNTGLTSCQSCHGVALDGGTSRVSCNSCHAAYSTNWQTDCVFCHGGTDNLTGAPPEGIDGETSRLNIAVGAHSEHVETTSMHLAWGCDQCHVTPTEALSPGHIDGDGRAEVTFGALNPSAGYAFGTGVCSNLYCHGNGSSILGTADWDTNPVLN
jgi:predicted CxxxxCH...CXXCH cytochrome family protein